VISDGGYVEELTVFSLLIRWFILIKCPLSGHTLNRCKFWYILTWFPSRLYSRANLSWRQLSWGVFPFYAIPEIFQMNCLLYLRSIMWFPLCRWQMEPTRLTKKFQSPVHKVYFKFKKRPLLRALFLSKLIGDIKGSVIIAGLPVNNKTCSIVLLL